MEMEMKKGYPAIHSRDEWIPTYVRSRSLGTSDDSLGTNRGFCNCWVRDGREVYGRSCAVALHS